jgi:hypothetical protein
LSFKPAVKPTDKATPALAAALSVLGFLTAKSGNTVTKASVNQQEVKL